MKNKYSLLVLILVLFTATLPAQQKKVLFEEFTNASCGPCAANNPALKAYIDSKGDTIVAVKYHTNFPGVDPMFNLNPTQVEQRRSGYYSDVNAVPWLKGDGNMFPDIWPFSLANFNNAFNSRKSVVPLVTMNIVDQRITPDSIQATITIHVPQTLPAGDYKIRMMAVEKVIVYPSPPGTNGESVFEHVFRKGYPDMTGVELQPDAGTYVIALKYKIEPEWIDTSMLTIAFVQNDAANKEVLNCAEGNTTLTSVSNYSSIVPEKFSLYQNYPNPFNPTTSIRFDIPSGSIVKLSVFNSIGQEVKILVNEKLNSGSYEYKFNANELSSGIYFYKLEANDVSVIRKMMLVK